MDRPYNVEEDLQRLRDNAVEDAQFFHHVGATDRAANAMVEASDYQDELNGLGYAR